MSSFSGENAEVMPVVWELQVEPKEGIHIGEDLWMAMYIKTCIYAKDPVIHMSKL